MDVLESASWVLQNQALTQNRLATDVNALASGLRVRSASDDPSGYAIAETIHSKVAGLQQSVTNVQTGNNLLDVAQHAVKNITLITQRIRSLIVEANSDVNSDGDLANIQVEINQLLLEINKISSETEFNGLKLFTGAYDNGSAGTNVAAGVSQVTPPGGGSAQASNPFGSGPGPFVTLQGNGITGKGFFTPAYIVFSVVQNSYSTNCIDPDTGTNIGPGVLFEVAAYSTDPAFGAAPFYQDFSALSTNAAPINNVTFTVPGANGQPPGYPSILLNINIGSITPAEGGPQGGLTIAFQSTNGTPSTTTTSNGAIVQKGLDINDGGDEGKIVSIDIPTLSTSQLNISNLNITRPNTVNYLNQPIGQSGSNNIAATASEQLVDDAIQQLSQIAAAIGAQQVALGTDVDNANVAIVNYTAAESSIRDADIGRTVTDYTKQQLLVSVGHSVLSQIEVSSQQLTALLLNSYAGLSTA